MNAYIAIDSDGKVHWLVLGSLPVSEQFADLLSSSVQSGLTISQLPATEVRQMLATHTVGWVDPDEFGAATLL